MKEIISKLRISDRHLIDIMQANLNFYTFRENAWITIATSKKIIELTESLDVPARKSELIIICQQTEILTVPSKKKKAICWVCTKMMS